MSKYNQVDLLYYCLDYPKRLSLDFMRAYCGFPTICALQAFAREYKISLERTHVKVIPISEAPAFGSTKDYHRYKQELQRKEMEQEIKSHRLKLQRITKDLTT